MTVPRHGEIWRAALDEHRTALVLIVSNDDLNARNPYVVPIARAHRARDVPGVLVVTRETDPVSGAIFVSDHLAQMDGGDLIELVGTMSGDTMMRVMTCIAQMFVLRPPGH